MEPVHLAVHDAKHFIIFASSPKSERWSTLEKTARCGVVIMNHESMDKSRNITSVSTSTSALYVRADHLFCVVPSLTN